MLAHLYADVLEEEGGGGKAGAKKKGGSMQTISATHRVSKSLDFKRLSLMSRKFCRNL